MRGIALNCNHEHGIDPGCKLSDSVRFCQGLPASTDACTRRSFLEASTSLFALGLGLMALSGGCGRAKEEADADTLSEAIRTINGDPADTRRIAQSAGWNRQQALDRLRIDADAAQDPEDLGAKIEYCIRQDFLHGRTHTVDLWWLSDTEVAMAVLMANHSN